MHQTKNSDTQKIVPHLWFNGQAEAAAQFYTSLFDDSTIGATTHYTNEGSDIHGQPEGAMMTVEFELAGYRFIGLNGGPDFPFTPAISFYVVCETEAEMDALWQAFSEDGEALMERGRYNWSEDYGWVQDRYGLTWQLSLGDLEDVGQKITPCLMYVSEGGQAEEAMNRYTSLFDDADVADVLRYEAGEDQPEGAVKHAQFRLNGDVFMAMDSSPENADFTFNEAVSLLIRCESQEEVDHFWNGLLADGGDESMCGWLKDPFGVSWQVVPTVLPEMLQDPDAEKVKRVTRAYMQMKKFDLQKLRDAYEGQGGTVSP